MNLDDENFKDLIKIIKEEQMNRKIQEKIYGTITKPLPKSDINNLDETSESSDDNTGKKLNNYPSDKGEKYDREKISDLNCKGKCEEVSGEERNRNRGAIPKKQYQNMNPRGKNDNERLIQKRDASCESNRSWEKNRQHPKRLPKREQNWNREQRSQRNENFHKISNRDGNNSCKEQYPFYYKVPKNPVKTNPLPPGTYLIIPQATVNFLPLKIYSHPCQDSLNNDETEKGEPVQSLKGRNWDKKNFQKGKEKEEEKFGDENSINKPVKENDESESKLPVKLTENHICKFLKKKFPFYDAGTLMREFYERNESFEKFHAEIVQRRRNEIQDKIFEEFPDIELEHLEEYITDAYDNFENITDFIESKKMKIRKEILEFLVRENSELDPELTRSIYNQYQGSEGKKNILMKKSEKNMKEEEIVMILNEIYSILPDADPQFISEFFNINMDLDAGDTEKLNDLLFTLLESKNYPKVKESDAKFREKIKLWRYYVTDFTVDSFLEKVPEPKNTFPDYRAGADVKDNEKATLTFLKMRYPVLMEKQINLTLSSFGGSISGTCLCLDKFGSFNNNIGTEILKENFNELFLQEICYCTHRKEILEVIRVEKERRELELEVCKDEKGFLECSTCFDDEVLPSDIVACPDGHLCCKICFVRYIETSFGSGKLEFICLSDSCNTEYGLDILEKFLKHNLFIKITERKAALEVEKAGISDLEKCPFCHYAYIPDPKDKTFRCENLNCFRVTCRLCKEMNHLPLSCHEVERPREVEARKRVEEAMSNKLVRRCPGCKKGFIKTDGCNRITCSCGTSSCYLCSAIISGYSHFDHSNSNVGGRCPLYTNDVLFEEEAKTAGYEEMKAILREDPQVKFHHDPTTDS